MKSITTQSRTGWLLFAAAFFLSLLILVVGWKNQSFVDNRNDPYAFSAMGASVARGDGFAAFGNMIHRRAPLYPLFIGAIYSIFGVSPIVVKLIQCGLQAGLCVLVWDIGRRMFNARTGVIAAVACMLDPVIVRYVTDIHLETLLTFLFTLSIWGMVRFVGKPTFGNAAIIGIGAGLAALTKAVVVLYPALFAVWYVWKVRPNRAASAGSASVGMKLALMFGLMALVIAPWTVRNFIVTGKMIPISTGLSDAYLRGLVFSKPEFITLKRPPYTDAENESNAWFRSLASQAGTVWERDDVETDKILNKEAKRQFLGHPGAFARKFLTGIFTFWYEMTSLTNSLVAGGAALICWAFAVVGIRRSAAENRPFWLLLLPILYLNILLAALLALGRYSAPVTPMLIILAAFGLDSRMKGGGQDQQLGLREDGDDAAADRLTLTMV